MSRAAVSDLCAGFLGELCSTRAARTEGARLSFGRMSLLLVFGDGPVSRALAPMAELVGWSPSAGHVDATRWMRRHSGRLSSRGRCTSVRWARARRRPGAPGGSPSTAPAPTSSPHPRTRRSRHRRRHPAENALAILAELVATVRGRAEVGSIKGREGPVHPGVGPGEAFWPTG